MIHEIEVGNARLHVEQAGAGPDIVLIHAGIADARMWDAQWDALTPGFRVTRLDLRGYGRSTIPPEPFAHHDDVAAVMERLGIARAVLVGASYGGNVATETVLEHPDRVSGLVLINTLVAIEEPSEVLLTGWQRTDDLVIAGEIDAAVEVEIELWVDGPQRSPDQVPAAIRDRVRAMNRGLFARMDEHEAATERELDPPAKERLGEIAVPTLVIVGLLDVPDALASADRLLREIPGATRYEFLAAAHLPSLEYPADVSDLIASFTHSLR